MILHFRRPAHVAAPGAGLSGLSAVVHLTERGVRATVESPLSLVDSNSFALLAVGGFRRWDAVVRTFTRLQPVFTFQALSAGGSFPKGGIRAVPDATAAAAGVDFRYNPTVTELVHNGGVVRAVGTDTGARFAADAVVLTSEFPDTYRMLGRRSRRLLPLRAAPSAVVAHVGRRAHRLIESPSRQRQTVVAR